MNRRFLAGPVVALALVGMPQDDGTGRDGGAPAPAATVSPTPTVDAEAAAGLLLKRAYDAEGAFYVDTGGVFAAGVGAELEDLEVRDPSVPWGTAVIVVVPASTGEESKILVLRAPLPSGESLCLAEVTTERDAGRWFARAAAAKACPKVRARMPGWTTTEPAWWPKSR